MTEVEIFELLLRLGGTPDEIAATLSRIGVRGHPHMTSECPLAKFLCLRFPCRIVTVGHTWAMVEDVYLKMPEACRLFVAAFDRGKYPSLFAPIGG